MIEPHRNSRRAVRLLLSATLLLALTGCNTVQDYSLTGKLWCSPEMRHFAEPGRDANLQIFVLPSRDVLVRYDELRERDGKIRRRAYLVSENAERLSKRQKPRFVNPANASNLQPVPMVTLSMVQSNSQSAIVSASYSSDRKEFTLIGMPGLDGTYELPVYVENNGNALRIVLTPLAVGGDIVVVGLVAGIVAAYAYAQGAP